MKIDQFKQRKQRKAGKRRSNGKKKGKEGKGKREKLVKEGKKKKLRQGECRVMTDLNSPQTLTQEEPKASRSPLLQTKKSTGNLLMNENDPKSPEQVFKLAVETMDFQRMYYTKFLLYSKGFTDAMANAGAELSKLSGAFKDYSDNLYNTEDPLIMLVSK